MDSPPVTPHWRPCKGANFFFAPFFFLLPALQNLGADQSTLRESHGHRVEQISGSEAPSCERTRRFCRTFFLCIFQQAPFGLTLPLASARFPGAQFCLTSAPRRALAKGKVFRRFLSDSCGGYVKPGGFCAEPSHPFFLNFLHPLSVCRSTFHRGGFMIVFEIVLFFSTADGLARRAIRHII